MRTKGKYKICPEPLEKANSSKAKEWCAKAWKDGEIPAGKIEQNRCTRSEAIGSCIAKAGLSGYEPIKVIHVAYGLTNKQALDLCKSENGIYTSVN